MRVIALAMPLNSAIRDSRSAASMRRAASANTSVNTMSGNTAPSAAALMTFAGMSDVNHDPTPESFATDAAVSTAPAPAVARIDAATSRGELHVVHQRASDEQRTAAENTSRPKNAPSVAIPTRPSASGDDVRRDAGEEQRHNKRNHGHPERRHQSEPIGSTNAATPASARLFAARIRLPAIRPARRPSTMRCGRTRPDLDGS